MPRSASFASTTVVHLKSARTADRNSACRSGTDLAAIGASRWRAVCLEKVPDIDKRPPMRTFAHKPEPRASHRKGAVASFADDFSRPSTRARSAIGGHDEAAQPSAVDDRLPMRHTQTNVAGDEVCPPIVHEVLRSPGRPLDKATSTFMESR